MRSVASEHGTKDETAPDDGTRFLVFDVLLCRPRAACCASGALIRSSMVISGSVTGVCVASVVEVGNAGGIYVLECLSYRLWSVLGVFIELKLC